MEEWTCECGSTHHLQPGVKGYKCAFCGHVKGKDGPKALEAAAQAAKADADTKGATNKETK